MVWICYLGDVVLDRGSVFLNYAWVKMEVTQDQLPQYQTRKAFRVLESGDVVCTYVMYIPFAKFAHDGPTATLAPQSN